ncbi:hypothetical protein FHR81_001821 [Actinoalloteichus hoggarensis]|uniref:Uncharacterized protein n=1 Tax=Actinoalloteichus hoggarensis TaxID=1470176 RepID=A0A221W4P0_9PSEU|nr:hypothetical protein AHOG_16130 [Actinoalloteichus hoggarensis]MBB5920783.1 hypothetical protein [Actinoalloteichus hoggarensis]
MLTAAGQCRTPTGFPRRTASCIRPLWRDDVSTVAHRTTRRKTSSSPRAHTDVESTPCTGWGTERRRTAPRGAPRPPRSYGASPDAVQARVVTSWMVVRPRGPGTTRRPERAAPPARRANRTIGAAGRARRLSRLPVGRATPPSDALWWRRCGGGDVLTGRRRDPGRRSTSAAAGSRHERRRSPAGQAPVGRYRNRIASRSRPTRRQRRGCVVSRPPPCRIAVAARLPRCRQADHRRGSGVSILGSRRFRPVLTG